jgi:hypothetical protein
MERMTEENTTEKLWEAADALRRAQLLFKVLPNKPMDEAKLKNLLEVADEADQVKLKVLYNATIKGVNEYNKSSSQIKLKNWKSAEKELDAYIDTLWAKYIDHERTFPNLLAVIDYLKINNWKIGKSRAYEHQKEGKIKSQANGAYRLSDVEKYAATHLTRSDGKTASGSLEKFAEEKAQAELDKTKEQLEHLRLKNKLARGMFVPREAFEQELAKRAAVIKSDVENFIRGGAEKSIAIVGGDPAKAPALIEHQLDAAWDWLNRYAGEKEFKVPAPVAAAAAAALQDTEDAEDE